MKRTPKPLLPICVVAALAALLLAGPAAAKSSAKADTPCWKTLIQDWYDSPINGTYPIPCYQQAIDHLPADVETYSSAAEDIRRARSNAIAGKPPPTTPSSTQGNGSGPANPGSGPGKGPDKGSGSPTPGHGVGKGPAHEIIGAGSPSHADSVPIPLIVLAGIAGLLLIAGSAGFIARRLQARRVPIRTSESRAPH